MTMAIKIISALAMFGAFSWAFQTMTDSWAYGLLLGAVITALLMSALFGATNKRRKGA